MIRRQFLRSTILAGGAFMTPAAPHYRAAIIGATGRGNYGHGHDLAFQKLPNVTVVAVADADGPGRERARVRAGAERSYADWRQMLERERPNLLAIGPRWVVDRLAMIRAAADVGAHVYMEKPLAPSLEEADGIIAAVQRAGIKTALAHQALLAPALVHCKRLVSEGLIGDLLEMRARGKEDQRSGGEDLMVLGWHAMYLMRYFAGPASWCSARVTVEGRDVTAADRRAATEPLGPVAGDSLHATYAFAGGVQGHFASQKIRNGAGGRFELALYGSAGVVMIHIDQDPGIYVLSDPLWSPGKSGAAWKPLPGAPDNADPSGLRGAEASNKRLVEDLIRAVETGGEPAASFHEGRAVLEMILAVYASHLGGRRAALPLANRRHPLGSLD
jgi:predicted dehydrogenase